MINNFATAPIAGCMRWGKWGANFNTNEYVQLIEQCISCGITSFDHADIYGDYTTEQEFGNALKQNSNLRSSIQIITKAGIQMPVSGKNSFSLKSYNTSSKHIITSVENSLKNFGTDYIDVFLIHRPSPMMHANEIAEAITTLKQQKKIIFFGVSNFTASQMDMLAKFIKIDYNQIEVSILKVHPFTDGTLDKCIQHSITPMAWAPLGGGSLTDDTHPRYRAIIDVAQQLCVKYNTGINQILIAFLLAHPSSIIPVVGTTKIERLIQTKQAYNIQLTNEDWFWLYTAIIGQDVP